MITTKSKINFSNLSVPPIIPAVQGDTGRVIQFELNDFTIPAEATATYYVQKPSGEAVYNEATISGNNVFVELTAQSIIEVGENYGQVRILVDEEVVTSFDFILLVKTFRGIEAVQSETEMNIFDKAVERAQETIASTVTEAAIEAAAQEAEEYIAQSIDPTLTITDKAADAKVAGDGLKGIAAAFDTQEQYFAGDYVRKDFKLYRRIADCTSVWGDGSWIAAKWQETNLGNEILQRNLIAASRYDHTRDYAVGEYCTHDRWLYRCISPVIGGSTGDIGNWDSTKWEAVRIGEELTDIKEALTQLDTRVDNIEEAEGLHRYGVSGIGQSASALTRLWDAVGMTAQVGTDGDNSNVINNFDDVTPFNRRKCVGKWHLIDGKAVFRVHAYYGEEDYAEDGSMGDYVAVECPRAFYYLKDGVLGVSAHQYPGWRPFDIFCKQHNPEDTIPFVYLPAYALALDENGHAVSLPGFDNVQGTYKDNVDAARTYDNGALGNLAILQPMAVNFYEWALYTVEFAQQNCQNIMYGCGALRHNADDRVTFVDSTHVLTNNYQAARVSGEYISIIASTVDINSASYQASHKITEVVRCDENGNASASGTHQLLTVQDLSKAYYEYDTTGATEYRIAARPYRTGSCNGVSTPSGSPVSNSNGYYPMKYRWRENVFGNQYKTIMDLFNVRVGTGDSDYSLDWYFLPVPQKYEPSTASKPDATDLATDTFVKLDIRTEHANYISGYIKSKKYSEEFPDIWIPYDTTGGNTTYFADYAYLVNSLVVRAVRLGGHWHPGAYDGFSFVSGYNAPSNGAAAYGGDLCFIQV